MKKSLKNITKYRNKLNAAFFAVLLMSFGIANAQTVHFDDSEQPTKATSITGLVLNDVAYDVSIVYGEAGSVYGDYADPTFTFTDVTAAGEAGIAMNTALELTPATRIGEVDGAEGTQTFLIGYFAKLILTVEHCDWQGGTRPGEDWIPSLLTEPMLWAGDPRNWAVFTPSANQPTNDDCSSATPIGNGVFAFATDAGQTAGGDNPGCGGTSIDPIDVWFVYTASCDGIATFSTCDDASFNTRIGAYDGCGGTILGCNDDDTQCSGNTSILRIPVTSGNKYWVQIGGLDDATGTGNLTVSCAATPANTYCSTPEPLTVNADLSCTSVTPGTIEAATGGVDANPCAGIANDDVWFAFTATATSHEISLLNITGSTTDLVHGLYEGDCGELTNLTCSDTNTSTASGLTIGNTYRLRVHSLTAIPGQTSSFDVCIGTVSSQTCPPGEITFTSQDQIDNYQTENPGCTEISGDVTIQESVEGNITSLNGLSVLESIGGSLAIIVNDSLSTLNGFSNLVYIGANLIIQDNPNLPGLGGLEGITQINGDLDLQRNPRLVTLFGLGGLTEIGGSFTMSNCDSLPGPGGLGTVTSIGMDLIIENNDLMTALGALSDVTSIGGNVSVEDNDQLPDLVGLSPDSIGGFLKISGNEELSIIKGLSNLVYVGTDLILADNPNLPGLGGLDGVTKINGNLDIIRNARLVTLFGLGGVTEIGGRFSISDCDSLPGPGGLGDVTSIGGDLTIERNDLMTALGALGSVTSIGGNLKIDDNDQLASLSDLESIDPLSITKLTITDNALLTMCEITPVCDYLAADGTSDISNNATGCNSVAEVEIACGGGTQSCFPDGIIFSTQAQIDNYQTDNPGCTEISGDVTIQESVAGNITSLNGLSVLESIGGSLIIRSNATDKSFLNGFSNLVYIGANLIIEDNANLPGLGGLEGITQINGDLDLQRNPRLVTLFGLGGLTEIGGRFMINSCDSLPGPGGLGTVTSIGMDLIIENNDLMIVLNALKDVTSIGGELSVINNDQLTSLADGLTNIDPLSITSLTIKDNALLTMCEITSVCDYVAADGTSDISNNATGCNSVAEVEIACGGGTSIDDLFSTGTPILTFPNPTNGVFHIVGENFEGSELSIFNSTGVLIQRLQLSTSGQVDVSDLPSGLYFLELRNEDVLGRGKIIKE